MQTNCTTTCVVRIEMQSRLIREERAATVRGS